MPFTGGTRSTDVSHLSTPFHLFIYNCFLIKPDPRHQSPPNSTGEPPVRIRASQAGMTEEHRSALPGCAQQVLIDLGTGRLQPKWGSVCRKRVKRREYATNRRWRSALCVKSVRTEPYVELGAASRLFLLGNTSLWKWSEGPAPNAAASGEERRWWRILCGLTDHERNNQLGFYALGRQETWVDNREHKWQIRCF